MPRRLNWKPVPLDAELLGKGFSKEFLGIEELTDYSLAKKNFRTGEVVITQKKRKQDDVGSSNDKQPPAKKLKQTKPAKEPSVKPQSRPEQTRTKGKWVTEDIVKPAEGISAKEEPKPKTKKKTQVEVPKQEEALILESDVNSEKETQGIVAVETTNGSATNEDEEFTIPDDVSLWEAMFTPKPVLRAIWELGFKSPTPIQLATLPAAMKGRKDVIGAAETGSGKTLAFGIPIIHGIMKDKEWEKKKQEEEDEGSEVGEEAEENEGAEEAEDVEDAAEEEEEADEQEEDDVESSSGTGCVRVIEDVEIPVAEVAVPRRPKSLAGKKLRALVITPTRELAVQIEKHLKAIAKYTKTTIALVIGGMAAPKQERLLNKGPDIVIATPGRLWELVQNGHPHLANLSSIRYLALDETDRLLEQGHFAELRLILEAVNKDPNRIRWRQNFIFSATLTLAHDAPERLAKKKHKLKKNQLAAKLENLLSMIQIRPKPKVVDLTEKAQNLKPSTLTEYKIICSTVEDKDIYLFYFLKNNPGRTLVFCNSINNVRRITSVFNLLQAKPLPLHAQMHQKQRLKHLERFTAEENSLLIATDVAARGLDIPNVQHVVHFQVPRTSENYVHRSGRTARASRSGVSVVFIDPSEEPVYQQLCKTLNKDKFDILEYPIDVQLMKPVKERVSLAKRIETLEHRMKKTRVDENWMKKMADEADILIEDEDDKLDDDDETVVEKDALKKELRLKRQELKSLLGKPLRSKR